MASMHSAGLISLSVSFPKLLRLNRYWEQRYPEMVSGARDRSLARVWSAGDGPKDAFGEAMAGYMGDPFRGTLGRRFLAPGETALELELDAATKALNAAGLEAKDIDLCLVSSFLPDQPGVGNSAFLAQRLGLRGAAWNYESACAAPMVGLETATAYVRSGIANHVLVVVSCTYSRVLEETDTMIWSVGDGAAAFVVGRVPEGYGVLATRTFHTAETVGAMRYEMEHDAQGNPVPRMYASSSGGRVLRETAEPYLRECTDAVLADAGVSLADVDFFVTTTPTAWYTRFCGNVLGYDASRTVDTHAMYANTGPVLVPTNLHAAASAGRIQHGDLVLLYAVGSVSSRGAALIRWSPVALGPLPEPGVEHVGPSPVATVTRLRA